MTTLRPAKVTPDGSLGYAKIKDEGYLVTIKPKGNTSTKTYDSDTAEHGTEKWARWGDDNLLPQYIIEDVEKNTILAPALEFWARAMCSQFVYGNKSYDEKGAERFIPVFDPQVESFLRKINFTLTYLFPACLDFAYFRAIFPEIVLDEARKQVVNITRQKAAHCRIGRQNEKTGLYDWCYINPNWDIKETNYIRIPMIDVDYAPVDAVKLGNDRRYIYPVIYPLMDGTYYPVAPWHSIRDSGWYAVAQKIPAFKEAYYENAITLRYHVEIADWWWERRYSNFWELTDEERVAKITETLDEFEDRMSGAEKSFKSIMSMKRVDEALGKEYAGWTISPIKNEKADKGDLETSQEANQHIMFSLGLHPSIMGSTPGGQLNTSGSEQRIALNNFFITTRVFQHMILSPVQFLFDYNGWDYEVRFSNAIIHTLDTGNEISNSVL